MSSTTSAPTQVHQPSGVLHQGVLRHEDDDQLLLQVHIQGRQHEEQPARDGDAQSPLPDERVDQLRAEASSASVPLEDRADDSSTGDDSVLLLDQELPIDDDSSGSDEEDGDMVEEQEQVPEAPPRLPPSSPLRETQAVPCVHEPVKRQLSGTVIEGSLALSMDELF